MDNQQPYDPHIPSPRASPYVGGGAGANSPYVGSSSNTNSPYVGSGSTQTPHDEGVQRLKTAIDETKTHLSETIGKVQARGDDLNGLADKSENLQNSASEFRRGANRTRRVMWWKDMKMKIIIGVGITVLILIIIGGVVGGIKGRG